MADARSPGPAPRRRRPGRVFDLVLVVALLVAGFGLFRHVRDVIDVDVFDETHYLHRGDDVAAAFKTPDNGPLYSLHYHLLHRLWRDKLDVYYVNYIGLTILLPCVLYVCLRAYRASRLTSIAAALVVLLCHGNFPLTPKVGHFALIILLVASSLARRCRGATRKLALLLTAALVASYARPECFLAAAVFGCWLAARGVRLARTGRLRPALPVLVSGFTVLVLALTVLGFPMQGSARSFMAFGQHYSLHSVAWRGSNVDPWTSWTEIVNHDFRGARSVASAAMANPTLFLRHIAYNVRDLLPNTVGSMLRLAFAPLSWVAASFAIAAGLAICFRRRLRAALDCTVAGARALVRERSVDGFAPVVLAVPAVVSVLIIFPRAHYILMAFVLLLVGGVAAYARGTQSAASRGDRAARVVMLALVPVLWAFPFRTVPGTRTLDAYTSIQFLRGVGSTEIKVLAPEGDYGAYLPETVALVHSSELHRPLARALAGIDVVVGSDAVRATMLRIEPSSSQLFEHPEPFGFERRAVGRLTHTTILVRRDLTATTLPFSNQPPFSN